MKGKRQRNKRWAEQDHALRAKCPYLVPSGQHEVGIATMTRISVKSGVLYRHDGRCLFCGQTVVAYDNGAARPRIYRAKRYLIEEVPW